MPSQRPIFATLALIYCLCLGLFSLLQNPRSHLNRYFAFYNFSNALYNAADYVIFIPNHTLGVWWVRLAGVGSSLMLPFLMNFVYELLNIADKRPFKKISEAFMVGGICLAVLHATPWIIKDANYTYRISSFSIEVPGILYPLFAGILLVGLLIIIWTLITIFKDARPIQRQKLLYVTFACGIGAIALSTYFLSFIGMDLPFLYYSLQAVVAFIFSYAIFKHNLIPLTIALRRSLLIIGIYIVIGILMAPLFIIVRHSIIQTGSWPELVLLIAISGGLCSLGPVIYGRMINTSALFQNTATSHITHEFKTPLNAIQSAKEILQTELEKPQPNPTKIHDYMDMIERNTARLETFVLNILSIMKAGETSAGLTKEACDVIHIVKDVTKQFPALQGRLQLETDDAITIQADQEALHQIFTNLISNAVKFSPEGPILIRIRKNLDHIEVLVEDKGQGIPQKELERIFEPFSQSKGNHYSSKGTGLGLAIAKRWVEAHQGKIWAESEGIGKGSRFWVTLPI